MKISTVKIIVLFCLVISLNLQASIQTLPVGNIVASNYIKAILLTNTSEKPNQNFLIVKYIKVYDGDTINVELANLPKPLNAMKIRLNGIDTPELGFRAACEQEADKAKLAKNFLAKLLKNFDILYVYNYHWDKFGGRILGDLYTEEGLLIQDILVEHGYAVRYNGKGQRQSWCP
jgi:micrococcal nuclease